MAYDAWMDDFVRDVKELTSDPAQTLNVKALHSLCETIEEAKRVEEYGQEDLHRLLLGALSLPILSPARKSIFVG
ncbi:hypothetical protein [Microvirga pudoricolor]|uniref:hypothetical protein n=1 Tax=Microvirga pudoricolor TaxID=2778729 RepID=UPI00195182D6|nr:hypothetical protein [Microvirga pudoricolor]MBM6594485.1 hypothetical protein [Microvirga pudoricolor]